VQAAISRTLNILYAERGNFISWPSSHQLAKIVNGFKMKRGIEGVVGAIDGSHIPISCPKENPVDYINRKGYHSVVLQAVCDVDLRFTDVYTGWPGSVHDSRIFRNSSLGQTLSENADHLCPGGSFLLGDAGYPLTCHLITPVRDTGSLSSAEKLFNYYHSSTHMVIERSFGLLKGRFQRLKMVTAEVDKCVQTIVCACILHNMCMSSDGNTDKLELDQLVTEGVEPDVVTEPFEKLLEKPSAEAKKKRNDIIASLV